MAHLDPERQAAVRRCLLVLAVPADVALGAGVGSIAVGMPEGPGAVELLLSASVGGCVIFAVLDWIADRVAAWLLAWSAPKPVPRTEPRRVEPRPAERAGDPLDRLFGRISP